MPLGLPDFSDLKSVASSLNPLNLFSDTPTTTSPTALSTSPPPSTPGAWSPASPPRASSSTPRRTFPSLSVDSPNGEPIPSFRPALQDSGGSSSSSMDGSGRRKSSGNSVMIAEPDGRDAEKRRKKRVFQQYIIVKPPPTASKNPLNLQIQMVNKSRGRARSGTNGTSNVSLRSASIGGASIPPSPSVATMNGPSLETSSSVATSNIISLNASTDRLSPTDAQDRGSELTLKRSSSRRSTASTGTTGTSALSTASGGAGRRIEPMFNLTVHSVVHPTVVTDAVTDAKVAKFGKRTVEITGVGVLEPVEIWLPHQSQANLIQTISRADDGHEANRRGSRPISMVSNLTSPISSVDTRSSDTKGAPANGKRQSLDLRNLKLDVLGLGGENSGKKFFGKIFRRKDDQENAPAPRKVSPSLSTNSFETSPNLSANGDRFPPSTKPVMTGAGAVESAGPGHGTLGLFPMVIKKRSASVVISPDLAHTGLTASLASTSMARFGSAASANANGPEAVSLTPSSRPVGYAWTVRKWQKNSKDGWAAHLVAAASAGLELIPGVTNAEEDEVVFEWIKNRPNLINPLRRDPAQDIAEQRPRSQSRVSRAATIDSPSQSRTSLRLQLPSRDGRPEPARRVSASSSLGPNRAPTPDPETASVAATAASHLSHGSSESDPEDSETPWTCSIWVKKTDRRQLLATIQPAPHHPRVVAQLHIPADLRRVALAEVLNESAASTPSAPPQGAQQQPVRSPLVPLESRLRTLSLRRNPSNPSSNTTPRNSTGPDGLRKAEIASQMAKRVKEEVCLSEENLKDVVCVTAMWLVAREFGAARRKKP